MNTKREIIGEVEQMAINAIVHQPDEKTAAAKHFADAAKKIVEKAMEAVDIMEIGDVCRRAMTGAAIQDYDLLAKLLTDKDFDHDRLAKSIEALASEKPIDYPTFYTPGWLCELAAKMGGPADGTAADGTAAVPPAMPGKVVVHDEEGEFEKKMQSEDKAAKKNKEWLRRNSSFCDGLFPIRRANCEKNVVEHCWIGGRRFTMELCQDIHDDGAHVCCAKIRDNGNLIARCVVYRGKATAEKMAHAAFKAYVKDLGGSNKFKSRGGFLKQAIKRAAAAKLGGPRTVAAADGTEAVPPAKAGEVA